MDMFSRTWRLELFYKSVAELKEKTVPFLKEHNVSRVNLTNKSRDDKLLESVAVLQKAVPHVDVCLHYSLKWNYAGGPGPSCEKLKSFLETLDQFDGRCSMLLVSGGGKKRQLDTVEALKRLKADGIDTRTSLHVAFNPYFPDEQGAKEERRRLKDKLASGLVAGVWLQTGSDIEKLESGLEFLRSELSDGIPIYGSVFLPSKRLLAQMRFRPWNGVFLSEEYLSSVEAATALTKELLACYRRYHVIPLLETALRTTQDMRDAVALLGIV